MLGQRPWGSYSQGLQPHASPGVSQVTAAAKQHHVPRACQSAGRRCPLSPSVLACLVRSGTPHLPTNDRTRGSGRAHCPRPPWRPVAWRCPSSSDPEYRWGDARESADRRWAGSTPRKGERTSVWPPWGLFSSVATVVAFVNWGALGRNRRGAIVRSPLPTRSFGTRGWAIPGRLIGLSFWRMMGSLRGPFRSCACGMGVYVYVLDRTLASHAPEWAVLLAGGPVGDRLSLLRPRSGASRRGLPRRCGIWLGICGSLSRHQWEELEAAHATAAEPRESRRAALPVWSSSSHS